MKRLHHVILMQCRCSLGPFQTSKGAWHYSMAAQLFRKYMTPHLDALIIKIIRENLDTEAEQCYRCHPICYYSHNLLPVSNACSPIHIDPAGA